MQGWGSQGVSPGERLPLLGQGGRWQAGPLGVRGTPANPQQLELAALELIDCNFTQHCLEVAGSQPRPEGSPVAF